MRTPEELVEQGGKDSKELTEELRRHGYSGVVRHYMLRATVAYVVSCLADGKESEFNPYEVSLFLLENGPKVTAGKMIEAHKNAILAGQCMKDGD